MLTYTDVIGYTCTALTGFTFLPQLHHMWKSGQTKDVSMFFLILNQIMFGLWLYYGTLITSLPIIISDTFISIINSLMILTKIYFDRKNIIHHQSNVNN